METTRNKFVKLVEDIYQVTPELDLICPDGTVITKEQMIEIADGYKGSNRIFKPLSLLFWTDVKNGNYSNWE